jgi:deoxycytidylate deaminase
MIINAGIKEVVYEEGYPDDLTVAFLKESDIKMTKY